MNEIYHVHCVVSIVLSVCGKLHELDAKRKMCISSPESKGHTTNNDCRAALLPANYLGLTPYMTSLWHEAMHCMSMCIFCCGKAFPETTFTH